MNTQGTDLSGMDWSLLTFLGVSVLGMAGPPVITSPSLEGVFHDAAQFGFELSVELAVNSFLLSQLQNTGGC